MKKIFIAMMAVAAFAACSTEEQIAAPKGDAIAFGDAFVDNATKAIDGTFANNGTGVNELTQFNVYGIVENANGAVANIFCAEPVSKSGSVWTYDPNKTQYWVAGNSYSFAAVKNGVVAVDDYDMPATIAYDVTTQDDVLYAEVNNVNYAGNVQPVKFTFNHLLSKVKFTVKNQMQYGNGNSYKVEQVRIVNAAKNATYTVDGTWGAHAGAHELNFGDIVTVGASQDEAALKLLENGVGESNYERLLIPQTNAALTIKVDVKYYIADKANPGTDVLNDSYTKEVVANLTLEAGKAYNFILTLGNPGEPITFAVENIVDWDEENVAANPAVVASADELVAAIAEGKNVVLADNITIKKPFTVAEGQEVIVDLGGKTLTLAKADSGVSELVNLGTVELKNGTISSLNDENCRRCVYNYGTMSIDGVTFKQVYAKKGAAINNEGNLTIENATVNAVYYSVYTSGANAVTTINGGTYTTTNDVSLSDTWSYGLVARNGSKLIINGGSFTGNHGVVAAEGGSTAVLNAGAFHCTATYTGNSDWTLYADANSAISYNAEACTVTTANPNGATYGNVTTF